MKKTREEEHAKKQPKKRGQKLWDTELPVVALVHRTPGDPGRAVGRQLQRGPRVGLLLLLHHHGVKSLVVLFLCNLMEY